ncbi:TonB system transport protein ExbD [Pseudomonas sp. FW306-02-F02-AA]|uniref:Biopolymer transporter ExbD n=1 Tax=Pseudomonas fluorescens TaxID=294 RepID=A0A0N9WCW3_PSEFL|nr:MULTISPECIES: biopolymer transporter ExbD [Pseudomonas]ALH99772.1 biopolymer transporter ExbD [Pseudomonas fluorescens]PMZ02928.1 TonB system transport protein ExbD [Pseudomonas sp. FW306-02-F02-AB]PMZ08534.1 TonB system transport protein ExbD [Pseudomonas sp. FW306-02-H06C]PMZ13944.1 TonB system transport protein ExbD [Pseudomonas sp. FW306-02-F02-AA]PMZ20624.1 TonB system transport protein ExbD [Pseudomonas sp. FW306-02-F08-AA]
MKFRRKQRENVDINLVSLIDVVFVLLLFFVVTTTFTRETQLRVDLPEAVSGSPAEDQQAKQLDIAISADGVFSVNNQLLPKNDLASLIDALKTASNGDTNSPLSISADGKTQHQAVVTAMDAAGKLGFTHLRMTTVEAAPAP